ncbi:MAG: FAD-dependent oxidoreductase, partial [Flammeovirgaceae bacterium]|nr:FAD-dependent oxidoreductase [Flammeovirgaceae bacterium]
MNRKDFIKLSALGLSSLPFSAFTEFTNGEDELYDVVVIGAGLSGLTAAQKLVEANKKVLVLEAQDRVGGRTWSQPIGGNDFIDVGGQWIGKGHTSMYQLVAKAGLKTFPTFTEGKTILRRNSQNKVYKGDTPPLGLFALLSTQKAMNRLDEASSSLSIDAPWHAANAAELDQISIGSWIDDTISNKKARTLLKRLAEGELCQSVDNVSALQAFAAARATGSFKQAEKVEDGALRDRIFGGAQGVSHYLHSQLKDIVKLNCPVLFVKQLEGFMLVGNEGFSVRTKKVVVTVPLPIVKKIQFTP